MLSNTTATKTGAAHDQAGQLLRTLAFDKYSSRQTDFLKKDSTRLTNPKIRISLSRFWCR